jgi:DNA-binding CsgD family transcriptional regulator
MPPHVPGRHVKPARVAAGLSADRRGLDVVAHFGVSLKTVQNHVSNVLGKLQVVDRTQAAIRGREAGLG